MALRAVGSTRVEYSSLLPLRSPTGRKTGGTGGNSAAAAAAARGAVFVAAVNGICVCDISTGWSLWLECEGE